GAAGVGATAADGAPAAAVIGPHVGASCYEVDAPVVHALEARFGDAVGAALTPTRAGHGEIDLARLAALDLARAGLAPDRIAILADACTACDRERFHSYRRDGPRSGGLFHFITARTSRTCTRLLTRCGPRNRLTAFRSIRRSLPPSGGHRTRPNRLTSRPRAAKRRPESDERFRSTQEADVPRQSA